MLITGENALPTIHNINLLQKVVNTHINIVKKVVNLHIDLLQKVVLYAISENIRQID